MRSSSDRILTTHVGSLPRQAKLADLLIRQEDGEAIPESELETAIVDRVRHVLMAQLAAGIDIVSDGEQSKPGFQTYVAGRMSGFGGESKRRPPSDILKFPGYAQLIQGRFGRRAKATNAPQAVSDIVYTDLSAARRDCERLRQAFEETEGSVEAFMTAPSPGIVATTLLDAHYGSHEKYLAALAAALRHEYKLIYENGFILQIDAPDLAMERTMFFQDKSDREFLAMIEMHVAAVNDALDGIPRDRVRLHCCWGNGDWPHVDDVPLRQILPVLYGARVGALSIEFANPRHQHEIAALREQPLPPEMMLIPGVIDSTTNYVEHPEVVAKRLLEAVDAVGDRGRIIAGVDCGFGTFAGYEFVAEDVVWAKLRTLREGADLATGRLWGKNRQ
jgi:5-methyltetrahydropteroyltriglutamate--homocysteine methyltransferase